MVCLVSLVAVKLFIINEFIRMIFFSSRIKIRLRSTLDAAKIMLYPSTILMNQTHSFYKSVIIIFFRNDEKSYWSYQNKFSQLSVFSIVYVPETRT